MRKTLAVPAFACLLLTAGLRADTVVTVPFLGNMLPANEVPPTSINSSATAIILVHEVFDSVGALKSGSVEFTVIYKFPAANTITGLHIHNAAAGLSGNIVVPTDVTSVAVDATGSGTINRQVQFGTADGQPALSVIQDLLANPQNYYVNIHTADFKAGAMRSQLLPATSKVLMAQMSPNNEVPPIANSKASAVASVRVLRAQDSGGNVLSAVVTFDANYTGFPDPTTFTGFHIHNGPAGFAVGVVINTGLASVPAGSGGIGNLHYDVLIAPANAGFAAQAAAVNGLFTNPAGYYINLHTTVNTGGEIRDQLRNTDFANFQVTMLPSNETPPIAGLNATAPSAASIYTIRNADGTVAAGTVNFDVNARFPGATTFNNLHIHAGAAGIAGSPTIGTDLGSKNVSSDTGNVNISKWVTTDATSSASLNGTLSNPSNFYMNLHTSDNPGGAVRSQLGAVPVAPNATAAAPNVSTVKNLAPGTIASIYGTNLAAVAADLTGFAPTITALPNSLNGVSVKIGGTTAPLYYVGPGQINAEVPYETTAGNQSIVVTTAGGTSTVSAAATATAPSNFILDTPNNIGAVVKGADFSLITGNNKVNVGDLVVIYSTGLGQTTPAVQTGVLVVPPSATSFNNTATATVTVDGKNATVVYSIASPGFTGLYQTAFNVPSGVSGAVPLVLSVGGVAANTVNLNVQ
jgi:uncharacterized protein (TIGR03437 family)